MQDYYLAWVTAGRKDREERENEALQSLEKFPICPALPPAAPLGREEYSAWDTYSFGPSNFYIELYFTQSASKSYTKENTHGKTSTKLGYFRAFKIRPHLPFKLKELQMNRKVIFQTYIDELISTYVYKDMHRIEFHGFYFGMKIDFSNVQRDLHGR